MHLSYLPSQPEKIDEVIRDIELQEAGACIHYVIDPFDLIDFCFPLGRRERIDSSPSLDAETLANDQISLFEVFFGHGQRPVLLDDYIYELQAVIRGMQREFDRGARGMEQFLDILREQAGLGKDVSAKGVDQVEALVAKDFNIILAVAIGLYSEGFDRLGKVCQERLISQRFAVQEEEGGGLVAKAFEDKGGLGFAEALQRKLTADLEEARISSFVKERIRRGAQVDSLAVGRILAANQVLEKLYIEKKLPRRHIFLYFSTAPKKTERIFDLSDTYAALPRIDGVPYSIWRTRGQILARIIAGGTRLEKMRATLEKLRGIIERAQGSSPDPDVSDLNFENFSPGFRGAMREYDVTIETHTEGMKNFGLVSSFSRFHSYRELAKIEGSDNYLSILKEIAHDPSFADMADQRRNVNLFFSDVKTSLQKTLLEGLPRLDSRNDLGTPFLRQGRDAVVGTEQHLPTMIQVKSDPYRGIASLVISYFKSPPQGSSQKIHDIREASQQFLDIDVDQIEEIRFEHELVRNLLFLALPDPNGDAVAYEHAEEMIGMIEAKAKKEVAEIAREELAHLCTEFRYLICWAARRSRKYDRAEAWASQSIEILQGTPDPRFYHARSLNTFSWHYAKSKAQSKNLAEGVTMERAIRDAEEALRLYQAQGSERRAAQLAALFNSLACFYCYGLDGILDLTEARGYLAELKSISRREEWAPDHPEYFHTEAYLEFEEYKAMEDSTTSAPQAKRAKLWNAKSRIDEACKIVPRKEYLQLQDDIHIAFVRLETQGQAPPSPSG